MPTYYARGVEAHLGTLPLDESTTPSIQLKKGETARKQSDEAETKLLRSGLLKETPVYLPSADGSFELKWLGNAPFMQACAGMDLFEEGASEADHGKRRALVLHLNLSEQTFVSGLHNIKTSLKIDVFFNGQLSNCLFMPMHEMRSGVKGHHQVFAGTRIDFLAERPWVILAPGVAADGTARENGNNKTPSVEHRWQHIAQALQEEARQRGTDEKGRVPPSALFLRALATMQIPTQVHDMQKSADRQFGTVDVVITAGEGKKLTSGKSYLKAPQRLADRNFPLILGNDGYPKETRAIETGRSDSDSEACHNFEPYPEMVDANEQGDNDPDLDLDLLQPRPKRRALAARALSTQHVLTASASYHPFMKAPSPSMPPQFPHKSNASALSPVMARPTSSFPVAPSARRINMSSSPERRGAYERDAHVNIRCEREHDTHFPKGTPSSLYSTSPSDLFTPQVRPSSYGLHFSDPVLGRAAPSDLVSPAGGSMISSPLSSLPMPSNGTSRVPPFAFSMNIAETNQTSFGSHQYSAHSSLAGHIRPSSFDSQSSPTNYLTSGNNIWVPTTPMFHAPIPDMVPRAQVPLGHHGCMPCTPSYDPRLSAPLPPTGLYTVPTKPKRSASPQKNPNLKRMSRPTSTMLVKRLLISGKDGATLVDQRWATTQRIVVPNSILSEESPQNGLPASKEDVTGATEVAEIEAAPRGSRRGSFSINSPSLTSPMHRNKPISLAGYTKEQKGDSGNVELIREPPKLASNDAVPKTIQANAFSAVEKHAMSTKKGNQSRTIPINSSLRAIKLAPKRRNSSGGALLGVQGPKAAPFVYDDPEEIVREASARLRRSRPSITRNPLLAPELLPGKPMPVVDSVKAYNSATSSPLSSAPTTPEPEVSPALSDGHSNSPTLKIRASIAQVDGSSELTTTAEAKSKACRILQTPSPKKLVSANAEVIPQSSTLKKRKYPSRCLPKEPRSPNRLKTASNPPLNRDCVIAYAEGVAQEGGNGLLRQIRGERQGVFTEEYVVFASRFYVAGN
jgi:hypothetical protein